MKKKITVLLFALCSSAAAHFADVPQMANEAARGADVIVSSRSDVIFTTKDAKSTKKEIK
jgi:hypothetical protein